MRRNPHHGLRGKYTAHTESRKKLHRDGKENCRSMRTFVRIEFMAATNKSVLNYIIISHLNYASLLLVLVVVQDSDGFFFLSFSPILSSLHKCTICHMVYDDRIHIEYDLRTMEKRKIAE